MNTFLIRFWTIFYTTSEAFCKTPLGETGCLGNPYFIYWLPKHPVFWFIVTQSVRLPMVTYPSLCSPTYGILFHAIGRQVFPTQPLPREAEDFPRGVRYFKHVPPLTYLICLSRKESYMVGLFKPYSCSDFWRICSLWDLNSFQDRLHVRSPMLYLFDYRAFCSMMD